MIETDALKQYEAFQELTAKEMKKALSQGLRKASSKVRTAIRKELKQSVKGANKSTSKYDDTLQQGVRTTKVREKDGQILTHVTISSNNKKGSGSFRLKFFDNGTNVRYAETLNGKPLKKKRKTGAIKAYNFFQRGLEVSADDFNKTLETEINKAVNKINDNKK